MESESGSQASTSAAAGQRRTRPHAYTAQACERCRSRKQRCVVESEGDSRNCLDSDSICVMSARPDKAKRARSGPLLDESASSSRGRTVSPPQSMDVKAHHVPKDSGPSSDSVAFLSTSAPTPGTLANMYSTLFDGRAGLAWEPQPVTMTPAAPGPSSNQGGDPTWQNWLSSYMAQQQQHPFLAGNTTISPTTLSTTTTMPYPGAVRAPTPAKAPAVDIGAEVSPGVISEEGSVFEAAKGLAMISLEAAAEPHYVGEPSGSMWSTVIGKGMQTTRAALESLLKPAPTPQIAPHPPVPIAALRQSLQRPIPDHVAAIVLETVYQHLHSRYPFMDWVTFDIQWRVRNAILAAIASDRPLDRVGATAAFFILMCLAIGAQLCKDQNLPLLKSEEYYALAQPYLNVIVQLHNLANVQGLLLLAMYSLRDSRGPSVWYISGVCIRLSIGLGLHRNVASRLAPTLGKYEVEMRKRVFWSCYTIDRMVAVLLGRPPGISDDDIDVDLPDLFVPEADWSLPSMREGSMRSSIHYIKLKQIDSKIQRAAYTVSRPDNTPDTNQILRSIDQWEAEIPAEAALPNCWSLPCCSRDWFCLRGVESRLQLLRPIATTQSEFLLPLAKNAARGCELQKRYLQSGQPWSGSSVRFNFICGLALLYAVFVKPDVLPFKDVFSAIKAASNSLFAYSHRDRTSEVLYDVFEELSSVCIEQLSQGVNEQPTALTVEDWQKASSEATNNIAPQTADDYVDFLHSLGLSVGEERAAPQNGQDLLWDLAAFSPGNLLSDNVQNT